MMRPDAKVEKVCLYPQTGRLPKIHRRARRVGRAGYKSVGV